jgi:CheY-like chemotaxis protein
MPPPAIAKVLIVDDEPHIRRVAELSLSRVGKWDVVLATCGPEALAAAERRPA